jgi:hypothetical protein
MEDIAPELDVTILREFENDINLDSYMVAMANEMQNIGPINDSILKISEDMVE